MSAIKFPAVHQNYYPLAGGLDLVTPAISINPGKVIDAQNYEPDISGKYRRIDGYERYSGLVSPDGVVSPTSATYFIALATITASITFGNPLFLLRGDSSFAFAVPLGYFNGYLVFSQPSGTLQIGDNLQVNGVGAIVGTITGFPQTNAASAPSDHADYLFLAANAIRTSILAVPGSGSVRGVWVYNDVVYAFRDNIGATAGNMYKATSTGWVQVVFGSEIQFAARTGIMTVTIAAPAVVTIASHGAFTNDPIVFTTSGALPTGLTAGTTYYFIRIDGNTGNVAATINGAAITTSGTQSGIHTYVITGTTPTIGATITGATSGATATVRAFLLRSGTLAVAPIGSIVVDTVVGVFAAGEGLFSGSHAVAQATTSAVAITRLPGGRVECFNYNFTGSTNTSKMYGADGVNKAFEFDGTTYATIRTGMATDTPLHVIAHKGYLFLSFLASVQYSSLGNPYSWTVVLGAGEIDCSKTVSGFLPQGGNINGSSLAIFTSERTFILYGSSNADFKLVSSIFDQGFIPYTAQQVSNDAYGMTTRGIQALITTLNYGDFDYSSISHMIQPYITRKRGLEIGSCTIRTKNQYRVFFSDNSALAVGLTGDKVSALMPLDYGRVVRCICSSTLSTGEEVVYFGSDDGYIYRDTIGTSQDGNPIESWCRLPFNNDKSPRIRKRFRRAIFEMSVDGFVKLNITYDLGYGNPNVSTSAPQTDTSLNGAGGYWDQFTWDQFTWDSQLISNPTLSIDGTEKNISFLFYSNRAQDQSHTLQGLTLISTPRALER